MDKKGLKKRYVAAVVLAAGKGVRMKSCQPKVLTRLCGKTLLDTVIDNLLKSKTASEVIVVLNKELLGLAQQLKAKNNKIKIAIQAKPLGTADAVRQALKVVSKKSTDIFVLSADVALITPTTLEKLIDVHLARERAITFLSAFIDNPEGYGRIIRNKAGTIERITEEIDLGDEEKEIREINSGIYCFQAAALQRALKDISLRKNKKEFYLTDVVALLLPQGVQAVACDNPEEALGINCAADLVRIQKIMASRIIGGFLAAGIKIPDPATTYIESGVEIGQDTVIYPFSYIESDVKIGKHCSIGPFARLRKGVRLSDKVTVGNFIELSRTRVGSGTLMKHFGYFGDSIIGKGANIGAGSVTANYDGKNKHTTTIDDAAFIGCDTVLIAPVKVGKGAVTGAGSVLVKKRNIPKGAVAVGVPAQVLARKIHKVK